ncbi:glycosyltransferase [Candidatus Woesearchaeota archaeon]|nr:glycosyltransferase [Candidatus Woesearchaeota archaeon]
MTRKPTGRITEGTLAVIIKTLNEERRIETCIRSCMKALENATNKHLIKRGEIILADSLSDDRTVEIARRLRKENQIPLRIIQLTDPSQRRCSVGPQMGYLSTNAELIYIIDGDMELHPQTLIRLIPRVRERGIAGAAVRVHEPHSGNLISATLQEKNVTLETGEVDYLEGGGMYKKEAVDMVGYLTDPQLYANEESDIGIALREKGFRLLRIDFIGVTHHRDESSTKAEISGKFASRYFHGPGQVLRKSVGSGRILKHALRLKIYLAMVAVWVVGIACLAFTPLTLWPIGTYLVLYAAFFLFFAVKKRSVVRAGYSLFKWNLSALGLFLGFFLPYSPVDRYTIRMREVRG